MSLNNDLMLDVSQAAELKLAFRRNGWNNAEIKTLSEGDILAKVLQVIKGQAKIKIIEHLIDCDADPFIPEGFSVEEHKKGGILEFNPAKIFLYLSKKQKKRTIDGHDLHKDLTNKQVLNANVLDYLLAHPNLIPKEWKGKFIFFWGTIYRYPGTGLCVRCLHWRNSVWYWNYNLLNNDFGACDPAAITK